MIQAICIANKRAELLLTNIFDNKIKKNVFDPFLTELMSCTHGDPPPTCVLDGIHYVYVFRDEFYWCCVLSPGSLFEECGSMVVIEGLSQLHSVCAGLCGVLTQHSIVANTTLLHEILMETMCGGMMQPQGVDKLHLQLYSNVVTPKESSTLSFSPGMFGMEQRTAPASASQQPLLAVDSSKREVFIDIVEKVWATVGPGGTVLRADVSGSITLHCFLQESPSITVKLNTDLSTVPSEGFSPTVTLSEVELCSGVTVTETSNNHKELCTGPIHGELTLLRYTLPPTLPHLLPFKLTASTHQLTHSDAELKLKLTSTTGMGTVAPHVVVKLSAPQSTATVMSRTSGPKHQTISFASQDKKITWTLKDFPGGSYAQAFIRLVDAGGKATVENGLLEFEVSKWVCSGMRAENVRMKPSIPGVKKWVRYLTTSDSISLNLS